MFNDLMEKHFIAFVANNSLFFIVLFAILLTISFGSFIYILNDISKKKQNEANELPEYFSEIPAKLDIKEAQEVLDYLNNLIREKFNYHLHSKLLPLYVSGKIPETKVVKEIKENIYLSVTASVSPQLKKIILKYFSSKGVELLIHEKIMTMINEVDFTMTKSEKDVFKDITAKNISKILS